MAASQQRNGLDGRNGSVWDRLYGVIWKMWRGHGVRVKPGGQKMWSALLSTWNWKWSSPYHNSSDTGYSGYSKWIVNSMNAIWKQYNKCTSELSRTNLRVATIGLKIMFQVSTPIAHVSTNANTCDHILKIRLKDIDRSLIMQMTKPQLRRTK